MISRSSLFYINGVWVSPQTPMWFEVVNPATEEVVTRLAMGCAADVDEAVRAARAAFPAFSALPPRDRRAILQRVLAVYERRIDEFIEAMRVEMGAPVSFARSMQAERGRVHLKEIIRVLENFPFEELRGGTLLRHQGIGVCGLITPWNAPVNQIVVKIAPALAAGCTIVLKPSEYSPLSALLFTEVLQEAGVPPGVFNLVNGFGDSVGNAIASHPDIDMVSFTGSTRAGILVAKAAAETVKRVTQELGGKSANVLLDDVDLEAAVTRGVSACFANSGQTCTSPTRMLVPHNRMDEAAQIAKSVADRFILGPTDDPATQLGPLVNRAQFERAQTLIQRGIDEGAHLVAGGTGLPAGITRGYYVRPTVFSHVAPEMVIAREEIFGPVLSIIGYADEEDAVAIANGTRYGLAAYVQSGDPERARRVARLLTAGNVHINYPDPDYGAPFGGVKQSGNGREWGEYGLREYLEVSSLIGYAPATK